MKLTDPIKIIIGYPFVSVTTDVLGNINKLSKKGIVVIENLPSWKPREPMDDQTSIATEYKIGPLNHEWII